MVGGSLGRECDPVSIVSHNVGLGSKEMLDASIVFDDCCDEGIANGQWCSGALCDEECTAVGSIVGKGAHTMFEALPSGKENEFGSTHGCTWFPAGDCANLWGWGIEMVGVVA